MEFRDSQAQALLLEVVDNQKRLLAQAARLLEIQQQEHARTRQLLVQAEGAVQAAARGLAEDGQRFATEALETIAARCGQVLDGGLVQPMERARLGMDEILCALSRAGGSAGREAASLMRAQALATWKSLILLALGAVFLVGGASAWAWQQREQARRYAIEADLGRRIGEADLVKCGQGLCASVDPHSPGQGEQGRYRPVRPRPVP